MMSFRYNVGELQEELPLHSLWQPLFRYTLFHLKLQDLLMLSED